MARDDTLHPDVAPHSGPQAVVGWVHHPLPQGIELRMQTTASVFALENQQIATTRLVLTRNQALLLATFLLKVTGHALDDLPEQRRSFWSRLFRRRSTLAARRVRPG